MRYEEHRLELDLTPDGEFRTPPAPSWSTRLLRAAILVAVVAGGLALAALALWFALLLIPVAIVAGLIAWAMLRFGGRRTPPGPFFRR
ncbi:MAG: hypothetical protein ACP5NI_02120 [Acetobacteraceae bacterium]